MKRVLLLTVDRWAPGLISIVTLCGVLVLAWSYDNKLSEAKAISTGLQKQIDILQKQIDNRNGFEQTLRNELIQSRNETQTWQAHVVTLRNVMSDSGLVVPKCPDFKPIIKKEK